MKYFQTEVFHSEYLDSSIADMIPSKNVPAKFRWAQGLHKLFEGAEWWQPYETIAADYIRQAIDNCNATKGATTQSLITKKFTWQQAIGQLIEILSQMENSV